MDIKEAWKRTSEILQEAQSKNMWCEIDSILAAHIREQTTLRAERDALAAKVRELEEENRSLKDYNPFVSAAIGHETKRAEKAEAELAAAKVKADALDRLEEMRANVQFYGDIVQLVQYDPYRCTDKNTTSLIDAIHEADRKDKP